MSENKTVIYGNARHILRRDTLENWEKENPILLAGEICLVTDAKSSSEMLKICTVDNTPWANVEYLNIVGKATAEGGEIFNSYIGANANKATGIASRAAGQGVSVAAKYASGEGYNNSIETGANGAHIEGGGNKTYNSARHSHNQGYNNKLSALYGHVGGVNNEIIPTGAFAHGNQLRAEREYQAVFGVANSESNGPVNKEPRTKQALLVVGNGTMKDNSNPEKRSTAFMVLEDGSAVIQTQGTDADSVVRKDYVDEAIKNLEFPTVSGDSDGIKVWQPSTHYKVGDYVLTYLSSGILDDGSGITPTALLYCIAEHTSPDVAYPNNDEDYNDRWVQYYLECEQSYSAVYALHDGVGNNIETTYATKEEVNKSVGDIGAALDELHNYAQALASGGGEQ